MGQKAALATNGQKVTIELEKRDREAPEVVGCWRKDPLVRPGWSLVFPFGEAETPVYHAQQKVEKVS